MKRRPLKEEVKFLTREELVELGRDLGIPKLNRKSVELMEEIEKRLDSTENVSEDIMDDIIWENEEDKEDTHIQEFDKGEKVSDYVLQSRRTVHRISN